MNLNTFIKKGKSAHDNKYDYSLVDYKKSHDFIDIICPKHGVFKQKAYSHLQGIGCPKCNESKGEKIIREILEKNNINIITQKTFNSCLYKRNLKFDFYLPNYNLCIEYDGIQHYKPNDFFGGNIEFEKTQKRDKIKNNYCKENNIKLIRIKYNENILDKLNVIIHN